MRRNLAIVIPFLITTTAGGCGGAQWVEEVEGEVGARAQGLDVSKMKADVPMTARWIGASGMEFVFDGRTFLVDPYLTRAAKNALSGTEVHPSGATNWTVLNDYLARLKDTPVEHVIVSHTHWDHAADVPQISAKTGARVWGSPNLRNLMQAHGMGDRATVPGTDGTVTIHDNPGTARKVELTLYPASHNSQTGLPLLSQFIAFINYLKYTGEISSTRKPKTVGDYPMDKGKNGIYAIKLRFIDGAKSTTYFITPPDSYDGLDKVRTGSEKIDVVVFSITNWDLEEKYAVPKILAATQPDLVIPVHHDDYYTGLLLTAEPIYPVPAMIKNVLTFRAPNNAEFNNFVQHVVDNEGITVAIPQMFGPLISGPPDPLAGLPVQYTMIKARSFDFRCFRHDAADDRAELGPCTAATTRNRWRYESGTGYLRNVTTDKCLERQGGALVMGACVTPWSYSAGAGLISNGVGAGRRCLVRTYNHWGSGNPLALGPCDTSDQGQRWAMLTMTPIKASHNQGLAMARIYNGVGTTNSAGYHPVVMDGMGFATSVTAGGVTYDLTAFVYEPATGRIRVADDPSYCLHSKSLPYSTYDRIVVRPCYDGTEADKAWTYDAGSGQIRSRVNPSYCMQKQSWGWSFGNPIILRSCASGGVERRTWVLAPSRGVPSGTITGKVTRPDGTPLANQPVSGIPCDSSVITDAAGAYSCAGVPVGTYTVRVTVGCPLVSKSKTVTVTDGATATANIQLGQGATHGTISGKAYDNTLYPIQALGGVAVSISGNPSINVTSSTGAYSFSNVPVGTITLTFVKAGYTKRIITLTSTCTSPSKMINAYLSKTSGGLIK